jgi:hypothetical protein
VLDHHIQEFELMRREVAPFDEAIKRALGGGPIQTDQGTYEEA